MPGEKRLDDDDDDNDNDDNHMIIIWGFCLFIVMFPLFLTTSYIHEDDLDDDDNSFVPLVLSHHYRYYPGSYMCNTYRRCSCVLPIPREANTTRSNSSSVLQGHMRADR